VEELRRRGIGRSRRKRGGENRRKRCGKDRTEGVEEVGGRRTKKRGGRG
jgi:hypothetical protein